jgi:diguanylate cyclase (GGDEF)-like protein
LEDNRGVAFSFGSRVPGEVADRLRELERELRRERAHHDQFVEFVHAFPEMTRELLASQTLRDIPALVLDACVAGFQPDAALVAMRRSVAGHGPGRPVRFIVAASHGVPVGLELAAGEGLCGEAARGHRILLRSEWEAFPNALRNNPSGSGPLAPIEVAAPMMVADEVIGILGIGHPHRHQPQIKDMLRLIARITAYKIYSLEELLTVRSEANVDGLTGILNKRTIGQRLQEAVFVAESNHTALSVFLFDIDQFKHYNDTQGHVAGDRLLRDLAALVKNHTRREHAFGRFGGEEFLLVLERCETTSALIAAENVRRAIASHPFEHAAEQPLGCLSVSGGVASFPEHGRSATELLQAADRALYEAKRQGRNRVAIAS